MVAAYDISHDWEEPEDLHEMLQVLRRQRGDANVRRIRYAYFLAEAAHAGQVRKSGEPYILHPLAVARIVVDLRMDDDTIVAALLHDVLEDCPDFKPETISREFGDDVLAMVEGVTKLRSTPAGELTPRERVVAETTRMAESLRKMLLAMAKDFRVMVIKLADRLHNMQTLGSLRPEKRMRIATETLNVYAPLAARLGIWQIKWQLEDLAFEVLHPAEFKQVSDLVAKARSQRESELKESILALKAKLEKTGLKILDIRGRPKHLYSIFNKMVKGVEFDDIYDLLALRIIVPTNDDCYLVMGMVHSVFMPIPGKIYDYIAMPKPNGYQSLHTKVVGSNGQPMEVQIRTMDMHEVAEFGVAAHWTYKEGRIEMDETKRLSTLREQLFDWSTDQRLSSDFLRTVSTDLFSEQTFVFTPKGDVIDLPRDSTPVDFAFRVHTALGMTLIGAKVNGAIAPLSSTLKNGDVVELVTRKDATPSLDWLQFVKSAHTRAKLRTHFRKMTKDVDAQRGRQMLDKDLKSLGLDPRMYLGEEKLAKVATQIDSCETATDVLARVGSGMLLAQSVISRLRGTVTEQAPPESRIEVTKTKEGKLNLGASEFQNVLLTRSKCCSPIPGDEVVGFVTRGKGIMIHRKVCPNAQHFSAEEPGRTMRFTWPSDGNVYAVPLRILGMDRLGLLMDVSTVLGESKTNVSALKVKTLPNQTAEIHVTADVRDTEHLSQVLTKISNFGDVISISRLFGRTAK